MFGLICICVIFQESESTSSAPKIAAVEHLISGHLTEAWVALPDRHRVAFNNSIRRLANCPPERRRELIYAMKAYHRLLARHSVSIAKLRSRRSEDVTENARFLTALAAPLENAIGILEQPESLRSFKMEDWLSNNRHLLGRIPIENRIHADYEPQRVRLTGPLVDFYLDLSGNIEFNPPEARLVTLLLENGEIRDVSRWDARMSKLVDGIISGDSGNIRTAVDFLIAPLGNSESFDEFRRIYTRLTGPPADLKDLLK